MSISPLAYIHPDAKLGKDVTVEPFAYIAGEVTIGDGTWIGPNAVINDYTTIGKNCRIFSGAAIGGIPQDLKFRGEVTTAEIGDNTIVRECATISRGTASKGRTIVGSDCLLMAYSHVGHDCCVGNHCILANNTSLAGEVEVDDWAILAGHVAVHQFVHIGAHVMIGGGAMVAKDVPPFVLVGHDASYGGINTVGLRRRGFSDQQIGEIQSIARILFQSGLAYHNAILRAEAELAASPLREQIIGFIRESKRGVMRGYRPRSNGSAPSPAE